MAKSPGTAIPDESVDLDGLDIVQLLEGDLDLPLVCLHVDDEDEGVVLLDLLHGALGVEGVEDDLVEVEAGSMRDRLAGVLGRPGELKGLGAVESRRSADLASLVRLLSRSGLAGNTAGMRCRSWCQRTPAPFRTALAAAPALSLGLVLPIHRSKSGQRIAHGKSNSSGLLPSPDNPRVSPFFKSAASSSSAPPPNRAGTPELIDAGS